MGLFSALGVYFDNGDIKNALGMFSALRGNHEGIRRYQETIRSELTGARKTISNHHMDMTIR